MLAGFFVIAVGVIVAVVYLSEHYLDDRTASKGIVDCKDKGIPRIVTIQNSKISPTHVEAELCDTLTITNKDDQKRLVAFGEHAHHLSYNGISEKLIGKNQNLTVTLNERGTYEFHDHLEAQLIGTVTIN